MTGIFFSGTGNTRFCIERFLREIDADSKVFAIEDAAAVPAIREDDEIVFAYPIYYSNLPKIVRDFITENRALWQGKRVFVVATMGLFSGDGAGVSARLFNRYGARVVGGLHLKMPDCIGDVKLLKKPPEVNGEIIRAAEEKIVRAAKRFAEGSPTREGLNVFYHLAGLFGQRLWFYGKTKDYTRNPKIDEEKCVGCGACERLCPMGNIRVQSGKAASGDKCTMCYRCFSSCPQRAITIIGERVIVQYRLGE